MQGKTSERLRNWTRGLAVIAAFSGVLFWSTGYNETWGLSMSLRMWVVGTGLFQVLPVLLGYALLQLFAGGRLTLPILFNRFYLLVPVALFGSCYSATYRGVTALEKPEMSRVLGKFTQEELIPPTMSVDGTGPDGDYTEFDAYYLLISTYCDDDIELPSDRTVRATRLPVSQEQYMKTTVGVDVQHFEIPGDPCEFRLIDPIAGDVAFKLPWVALWALVSGAVLVAGRKTVREDCEADSRR